MMAEAGGYGIREPARMRASVKKLRGFVGSLSLIGWTQEFMKSMHLPLSLTLAVFAVVLADAPLTGQVRTLVNAHESAVPTSPVAPHASNLATFKVEIKAAKLKDAVDQLQQEIVRQTAARLNVLFAPGAADLAAPELSLQNVTGPDALRLLVASAGGGVETIIGDSGQTIGYKLVVSPPEKPLVDRRLSSSYVPKSEYTGAAIPRTSNPTTQIANPRTSNPTLQVADSASAVISFTPTKPDITVRVYAALGLTGESSPSYADVRNALHEIFNSEKIPAESVEISLHEQTSVLVVKGEARVHEIVGQLLDALKKNGGVTLNKNEVAKRERALDDQIEDAQIQSRNAERKMREAERELERLQTAASNPENVGKAAKNDENLRQRREVTELMEALQKQAASADRSKREAQRELERLKPASGKSEN
jgi:hypothetical protein